jgi:hypothetical protein
MSQISGKDGGVGGPAIWIDGGIHAREWIAPATILFFVGTVRYRYRLPFP